MIARGIVLAAAGILATSVMAQQVAEPPWFGRELLSPDQGADTALYPYAVHDRAGFIDAAGHVVIPPQFRFLMASWISGFHGGVASVVPGWIDQKGRPLPALPDGSVRLRRASDGLIRTSRGGGAARKYGFVDLKGRRVIEERFDDAEDFSEGLAAVRVGGRWGYVDQTGAMVIEPQFLKAEPFSEGAARVYAGGPCLGRMGGGCFLPSPHNFGAPQDVAGLPVCEYSFIGRDGQPFLRTAVPTPHDFHEGLAAVPTGRGWGFMDKSGALRITTEFEQVGDFSDGMARFRQGLRWGYLDRAGRVVIPAQFEWTASFSEGAALVGQPYGKFWYIDKTGAQLFAAEYDRATSFRMGLAHVCAGQKCAYVNMAGRPVFEYDADDLPAWR